MYVRTHTHTCVAACPLPICQLNLDTLCASKLLTYIIIAVDMVYFCALESSANHITVWLAFFTTLSSFICQKEQNKKKNRTKKTMTTKLTQKKVVHKTIRSVAKGKSD